MAKDPKSPTIRALRDQGKLEEILYPEGRPENMRSGRYDRGIGGRGGDGREALRGREGGRSMRSISKEGQRSEYKSDYKFDSPDSSAEQYPSSNPVASKSSAADTDLDSFLDDLLQGMDIEFPPSKPVYRPTPATSSAAATKEVVEVITILAHTNI